MHTLAFFPSLNSFDEYYSIFLKTYQNEIESGKIKDGKLTSQSSFTQDTINSFIWEADKLDSVTFYEDIRYENGNALVACAKQYAYEIFSKNDIIQLIELEVFQKINYSCDYLLSSPSKSKAKKYHFPYAQAPHAGLISNDTPENFTKLFLLFNKFPSNYKCLKEKFTNKYNTSLLLNNFIIMNYSKSDSLDNQKDSVEFPVLPQSNFYLYERMTNLNTIAVLSHYYTNFLTDGQALRLKNEITFNYPNKTPFEDILKILNKSFLSFSKTIILDKVFSYISKNTQFKLSIPIHSEHKKNMQVEYQEFMDYHNHVQEEKERGFGKDLAYPTHFDIKKGEAELVAPITINLNIKESKTEILFAKYVIDEVITKLQSLVSLVLHERINKTTYLLYTDTISNSIEKAKRLNLKTEDEIPKIRIDKLSWLSGLQYTNNENFKNTTPKDLVQSFFTSKISQPIIFPWLQDELTTTAPNTKLAATAIYIHKCFLQYFNIQHSMASFPSPKRVPLTYKNLEFKIDKEKLHKK